MVSSKDAKEVGNREHHTHSGICVAFHLWFAGEKEWRVFISFPIRLGKKLLDSGVCTLADSELIPLITEPVAMSRNCTKLIHNLMTSNILETFDLSFTSFSHINHSSREVDFSMIWFHWSPFHRSNCHQIMHWEHQTNFQFGCCCKFFHSGWISVELKNSCYCEVGSAGCYLHEGRNARGEQVCTRFELQIF